MKVGGGVNKKAPFRGQRGYASSFGVDELPIAMRAAMITTFLSEVVSSGVSVSPEIAGTWNNSVAAAVKSASPYAEYRTRFQH